MGQAEGEGPEEREAGEMKRTAVFSPDGKRRFELTREWDRSREPLVTVNFVSLNPSIAGVDVDDMTVRKDCGFARRWGFERVVLTNLIAHVATDPWDLPMWSGFDPENIKHLDYWIENADMIVLAWGSVPKHIRRNTALAEHIARFMDRAKDRVLYCIGRTTGGDPLHPSRAAYTAAPIVYRESLTGRGKK